MQCQSKKTQTPEAGCSERVENFAKAFKDPCQGDGCKNGETVENATKGNICKEQKLKYCTVDPGDVFQDAQPRTKENHGRMHEKRCWIAFCNHQQGPSTRVYRSASGEILGLPRMRLGVPDPQIWASNSASLIQEMEAPKFTLSPALIYYKKAKDLMARQLHCAWNYHSLARQPGMSAKP